MNGKRLPLDFVNASLASGMLLLGSAAAYFDLAIAACEEGLFREKYLYFNRACVAALTGDKKRALEFLSAAVDKGLADIDLLGTTKALDPIRTTDGFREIMEKARKTGQAEKRSSH